MRDDMLPLDFSRIRKIKGFAANTELLIKNITLNEAATQKIINDFADDFHAGCFNSMAKPLTVLINAVKRGEYQKTSVDLEASEKRFALQEMFDAYGKSNDRQLAKFVKKCEEYPDHIVKEATEFLANTERFCPSMADLVACMNAKSENREEEKTLYGGKMVPLSEFNAIKEMENTRVAKIKKKFLEDCHRFSFQVNGSHIDGSLENTIALRRNFHRCRLREEVLQEYTRKWCMKVYGMSHFKLKKENFELKDSAFSRCALIDWEEAGFNLTGAYALGSQKGDY